MSIRAAVAVAAAVTAFTCAAVPAPVGAQEPPDPVPLDPYVVADPGVPSFYAQPWRSYLETVPATQFLAGVGTSWHFPAGTDEAVAMRLLREAGIRALRLEISWSVMAWPGDELDEARTKPLAAILDAARAEGIRPLILLNANHGLPGPHLGTTRVVESGGQVGSTRLVLDSVDDLTEGRSGVSNLTERWMGEVLFTSIDAASRAVTLSKPLPVAIPAGTSVEVDTLRYLPLASPGDPRLDETIDGWVRYARAVMSFVRARGFDEFDVEIWNELAFGSKFLDLANYDARYARQEAAKFQPGGSAWLLAQRTTDVATAEFPGVDVIWGFSNTSFFTTEVADLPPGTDGESFHPYHTAPILTPDAFPLAAARPGFDFVPDQLLRAMPEGEQQLGLAQQTLIRSRLAPALRSARPPGTDRMRYLFTEHGVVPGRAGIADEATADAYKARAVLRILAFWLGKGIDAVYLSTAYDADPLGPGLVPADVPPAAYGEVSTSSLLTPALRAIGNLTGTMDGAERLATVRQLDVEVASEDAREVFAGDASHPPLLERDLFAMMPYQVTPTRFAIPAYVMTYDLRERIADTPFRVTIGGLRTGDIDVSLYDPLTDDDIAIDDLVVGPDSVTFTMPATDTPRVILLDEDPSAPTPAWVGGAAAAAVGALVLVIIVGVSRLARAGPAGGPGRDRRRRRRRGL